MFAHTLKQDQFALIVQLLLPACPFIRWYSNIHPHDFQNLLRYTAWFPLIFRHTKLVYTISYLYQWTSKLCPYPIPRYAYRSFLLFL